MTSQIIQNQLNKLKNEILFSEEDNKIIFYQRNSNIKIDQIKVTFEDYIIKPFEGFDFHQKFNNNQPPTDKIMYGNIIKETEKMFYFDIHSELKERQWQGWCPKKSCKVIYI